MELKAQDLTCERGGRIVFRGVSLSLQPGQLMQLTGPNGSGKSSLLRLIAGLNEAQTGSVELIGGSDDLSLGQQAHYVAHWLSTSLPLAIAAPILGFLVNLEPSAILPLAIAVVVGSIALSLLAAIGAAVTVGLRRGGLLVSILVLPLYVPVLIFGLSASQPGAAPGLTTASLLILGAIALVSLVVSPLASAAALRSYLK